MFRTLSLHNCVVGKNSHADVCRIGVNKIESIEGDSTLARSLLISATGGSVSHKACGGEVGILSHLVSCWLGIQRLLLHSNDVVWKHTSVVWDLSWFCFFSASSPPPLPTSH